MYVLFKVEKNLPTSKCYWQVFYCERKLLCVFCSDFSLAGKPLVSFNIQLLSAKVNNYIRVKSETMLLSITSSVSPLTFIFPEGSNLFIFIILSLLMVVKFLVQRYESLE